MGIVYVFVCDVGGMIYGEQFDDRSEVEVNVCLMVVVFEFLDVLVVLVECE